MSTPAVSTFKTGHIGLNVSDLDRSKQFYQQVFGFDVVMESEEPERQFAFLGHDSNIVLTLWQQSSGRFTKNQPGLHHLSFQVSSIDDVQHVEHRLRDMNVHFLYDGVVPHAEGASSGGIYFEDPDGIRLEIFTTTGAEDFNAPSHGPSCGLF
ncbi:MAG: VOC family protein [Chloroflexi bacterium]|nr:VOC family protein [Chloroflexota bacterium]